MNKRLLFNFLNSFSKKRRGFRVALSAVALFAMAFMIANTSNSTSGKPKHSDDDTHSEKIKIAIQTDTLIVAGGCFWCVESDFEKYPGVIDVVSGYTGGTTDNPTYKEVTYKNTGHYEAAKITFDTNQTSIKELTEYFWATIDPTDDYGQFCDKGHSYKTALFYQNEEQKLTFEESLTYLKKNKPFSADIVTPILPANTFYLAEDYHQDFYTKNPLRYSYYRNGCGRDNRIKQLWGKVASKEIKKS